MYKIEKGHTYYFNDDIVVVKINDNYNVDCVIDDDGYKLLSSINVESLAIDGGCLLVNGKTKIGILDKKLPKIEMPEEFTTYVMTSNIKKALHFVATDKSNPILTGIYITSNGTIVATDRYKMYADYQGNDNGVVISSEFAKAICELDDVQLLKYNSNSVAAINNDGTIVFGKLLQGNFPDIFKLLEPKGINYTYNPNKLKKSLQIGSITKPNFVQIKDGKIIFEGDINTFVDETDLKINYKVSLDSLKFAIDYNEFYYQDENKPILFVNNNEVVLIVGMR